MRVIDPASIRSGRTGEDTEVLSSEWDRIFGKPTIAIHGGGDDLPSMAERVLMQQEHDRSIK